MKIYSNEIINECVDKIIDHTSEKSYATDSYAIKRHDISKFVSEAVDAAATAAVQAFKEITEECYHD